MPTPYFNDVTLTTGYLAIVAAASLGNTPTATEQSSPSLPVGAEAVGALGSAGLSFTGTLSAPAGNAAVIIFKSLAYPAVTGSLPAGASLQVRQMDLSQVQIKCSGSAILSLFGSIDH